MKTVYLLRHAKSSRQDTGIDDVERPLAPRGRKAAPCMARYLRDRALVPGLVLCSPARRSRETWDLMAPILGSGIAVKSLRGLYPGTPGRVLAALRRLPETVASVLVIGHNPALEAVAARCAGPASDLGALQQLSCKFPTAALAEVHFGADLWRDLTPARGRLERFVRPRDLTRPPNGGP